jgi:predicted nucleotide-binding protein (sugar kinase/HSP70/actin superfamily)
MGRKPSLTLELDSHTADAGLETRVEAFLDIVTAYRKLAAKIRHTTKDQTFLLARTTLANGTASVITSSGESIPMTDPRVTLLVPSMGRIGTEAVAAVFRGKGFNVVANPPSDETVLKLGRGNTSCKECLPLILTTGILLNYIQNKKREDEILVYFMPTSSGPCRFGQYHIFMEDLVKRLNIPDVALFALTSENSYLGLGNEFQLRLWDGIVISDILEDIRSMLLANAQDTEAAIRIFNKEMRLILDGISAGEFRHIEIQLGKSAKRIKRIPMKRSPEEVPTIALVGEIFVRRDALSRGYLTERLAQKGFATICSPIAEWILYSDFLVEKGLVDHKMTKMEKLAFIVRKKFMARHEKRIKSILSETGMIHSVPLDLKAIITNAIPYISPSLTGEAILTVGSSLAEIASHACGVIAIGPFGCMPNRLSEAILNQAMVSEEKMATDPKNDSLRAVLSEMAHLPFLAVESDGSPFPQLITAKLEAFCLQAERLHDRMRLVKNKDRWKNIEIRKLRYSGADVSGYCGTPNTCAACVSSEKNFI